MVRQSSVAFLVLVASSLGSAACENTPATPQVALASSLTKQTKASEGFDPCPTYGSWLQFGEFRGPTKEQTSVVVDGADQNGAGVSLECSVAAGGKGFKVDVLAELIGTEGGSVRITGDFSTEGVQEGVTAVFQRGDYGQFTATNCTVSYFDEGEDQSQPTFRGVAAGRVWGFLTCEAAENVSSNKACRATTQFRFENCGKE